MIFLSSGLPVDLLRPD